MGEMRNSCKSFVGKRVGKRPFEKPRHIWKYNIKTNLKEVGWKGVDWTHLAQDRYRWQALVTTLINLLVS
jgi:hypothetical protein